MAKQPGLTLAALRSRLERGDIAPVYIVTGDEPFVADEAVRSITAAVAAQGSDLARTFYHGDEAGIAAVMDAVRTLDLFSPARLVTVSPADQFIQRAAAPITAYAANAVPGGHLVLVTSKVDGRRNPARAVSKIGGLVACNRIYPREVVPWIPARVRAMGRQVESAAAALLADFLGTDLAALAGELDKLAVYLDDRKRITADDVEAVSLRDRSHQIFDLTDAVGCREARQALIVLHRLLERGEKASHVLFMVSRHLRRLWTVKELVNGGLQPRAAAAQVGQHYFVEQFLVQVDLFSRAELRRNCSELARCEGILKSSTIDGRILLETTLLRLVRQRPGAAEARSA